MSPEIFRSTQTLDRLTVSLINYHFLWKYVITYYWTVFFIQLCGTVENVYRKRTRSIANKLFKNMRLVAQREATHTRQTY